MSAHQSLNPFHIMVTRPSPAGEKLCAAIQARGGSAVHFPTLAILPCSLPLDLHVFDWAIFISPQAVYHSVHQLLSLPKHIVAIGEGTADALRTAKLPVHAIPKTWTSEGLLALPVFEVLAHKKIAIIKGHGGRETLAQTLAARGAEVTSFQVYQRVLPNQDVTPFLDLIRYHRINVIICTSNEGILNLKQLLQGAWEVVQQIPILVISERMVKYAESLGFKTILLAKNASLDAILETLAKGKKYVK